MSLLLAIRLLMKLMKTAMDWTLRRRWLGATLVLPSNRCPSSLFRRMKPQACTLHHNECSIFLDPSVRTSLLLLEAGWWKNRKFATARLGFSQLWFHPILIRRNVCLTYCWPVGIVSRICSTWSCYYSIQSAVVCFRTWLG